jgi:hypothetical protein
MGDYRSLPLSPLYLDVPQLLLKPIDKGIYAEGE